MKARISFTNSTTPTVIPDMAVDTVKPSIQSTHIFCLFGNTKSATENLSNCLTNNSLPDSVEFLEAIAAKKSSLSIFREQGIVVGLIHRDN